MRTYAPLTSVMVAANVGSSSAVETTAPLTVVIALGIGCSVPDFRVAILRADKALGTGVPSCSRTAGPENGFQSAGFFKRCLTTALTYSTINDIYQFSAATMARPLQIPVQSNTTEQTL